MKKIYILNVIAWISMLVCSCDKWLDLQPQDGITQAEFWKTKEDVRAALTGIYSSLNSGSIEERLFVWGELRADMVSLTSYASEDNRLVKNYNILSTNMISNWGSIYTAINNCNLLIDYAPNAKSTDPTFTDAEYNTYVGEALTIRSFLYFYLTRTFQDIPLKLKGTSKDTDIVSVGQKNQSDVLKQIEADLIKAQSWVPEFHNQEVVGSAINSGRITKPAVTALLADVYLWLEQYDKVEIETNKILDSKRYQLIGRATPSIFDGGTPETIFEISHKQSIENPMFPLVVLGRRPYMANVDILNSEIFQANTDVDLEAFDSRGEGILYSTGGVIFKYGFETPDYYNFQIYRISDVMLMRAEALAELGRGAESLLIIRELRERRAALKSTDRELDENDTDAIVLFVFEERARELAFEGKRWFDLLRLARKDNYSNLNVLIELVTKVTDSNVQQSAINKVRDINSHYLPILETELFKDTQLKQNPFYLK